MWVPADWEELKERGFEDTVEKGVKRKFLKKSEGLGSNMEERLTSGRWRNLASILKEKKVNLESHSRVKNDSTRGTTQKIFLLKL